MADGHGGPWNAFVFFDDPDGNSWAVQEKPATLFQPGSGGCSVGPFNPPLRRRRRWQQVDGSPPSDTMAIAVEPEGGAGTQLEKIPSGRRCTRRCPTSDSPRRCP